MAGCVPVLRDHERSRTLGQPLMIGTTSSPLLTGQCAAGASSSCTSTTISRGSAPGLIGAAAHDRGQSTVLISPRVRQGFGALRDASSFALLPPSFSWVERDI